MSGLSEDTFEKVSTVLFENKDEEKAMIGSVGGVGGFNPAQFMKPQGVDFTSQSGGNSAAREARMQERFNAADADRSGGLSVEEFESAFTNSPRGANSAASASEIFAQRDGNGDGQITSDEMGPPQGGGRPEGAGGGRPMMASDMLSTLLQMQEDSSGNDLISQLTDLLKSLESSDA
ncbi:MAG: EF-hand domain-containing protein [Parvibaculum sp.]